MQHKFEVGLSKTSTGLYLRLKGDWGHYNESLPITTVRNALERTELQQVEANHNVSQINYD